MDEINNWVKVKSKFISDNYPDFQTHFNYVQFMREITDNLKINLSIKPDKPFSSEDKNLFKKITLIKLTLENLNQEFSTINKEYEFAQVCISWISVKSYYLLFNTLLVLRYLLTKDPSAFNCHHSEMLNWLLTEINNKEIVFSEKKLNTIFSYEVVKSFKFIPGSNIKIVGYDPEVRYKQLLKKIEQYKEENFKYEKKIKSIRKTCDKKQINEFRSHMKIGLFEFFYWYRIKANYRDLEFLNKSITTTDFYNFYCNYYTLTLNVFMPIRDLINQLSLVRFNKNLF